MGSLEANIEMVVMARNLPNDRIDFSMPGGSAREEIAITILLSKHQRAKIGEVQKSNDDDSLAQSHVHFRYADAATEPVACVVGTKRHPFARA